jgi:hypothetical protein
MYAVRYNAVALFIEAFPVQNPDAPVADTEQALQKQFDQLQALLIEPEVSVRTLGVTGMTPLRVASLIMCLHLIYFCGIFGLCFFLMD